MLRLLSILFIVPYVFGDCAYHWGDYAFKEVRCRVIRIFFSNSSPHDACDSAEQR